jgi:hypothetical protein
MDDKTVVFSGRAEKGLQRRRRQDGEGDEPSNYVDEKQETRQHQRSVERKINKGTSFEMKVREDLSKQSKNSIIKKVRKM